MVNVVSNLIRANPGMLTDVFPVGFTTNLAHQRRIKVAIQGFVAARSRILARDASLAAAHTTASIIGAELGWDLTREQAEVSAYRASIEHERTVGGLPSAATDNGFGA